MNVAFAGWSGYDLLTLFWLFLVHWFLTVSVTWFSPDRYPFGFNGPAAIFFCFFKHFPSAALSDFGRTGQVTVRFCSGIRFVPVIADIYSAFSCPDKSGLEQPVFGFLWSSSFLLLQAGFLLITIRSPVSCGFSWPVATFLLLLPIAFLQFPFPI